jgi:hypothetical protein
MPAMYQLETLMIDAAGPVKYRKADIPVSTLHGAFERRGVG